MLDDRTNCCMFSDQSVRGGGGGGGGSMVLLLAMLVIGGSSELKKIIMYFYKSNLFKNILWCIFGGVWYSGCIRYMVDIKWIKVDV